MGAEINQQVTRKQGIINWSLSQLAALQQATDKGPIPPQVADILTQLQTFQQNAKWVDYNPSNALSTDWVTDLNSIKKIRVSLIEFMNTETDIHTDTDYKKDWYDVIEAVLVGLAEQWPEEWPKLRVENQDEKEEKRSPVFLTLNGYQIHREDVKKPSDKIKLTLTSRDTRRFSADSVCTSSETMETIYFENAHDIDLSVLMTFTSMIFSLSAAGIVLCLLPSLPFLPTLVSITLASATLLLRFCNSLQNEYITQKQNFNGLDQKSINDCAEREAMKGLFGATILGAVILMGLSCFTPFGMAAAMATRSAVTLACVCMPMLPGFLFGYDRGFKNGLDAIHNPKVNELFTTLGDNNPDKEIVSKHQTSFLSTCRLRFSAFNFNQPRKNVSNKNEGTPLIEMTAQRPAL